MASLVDATPGSSSSLSSVETANTLAWPDGWPRRRIVLLSSGIKCRDRFAGFDVSELFFLLLAILKFRHPEECGGWTVAGSLAVVSIGDNHVGRSQSRVLVGLQCRNGSIHFRGKSKSSDLAPFVAMLELRKGQNPVGTKAMAVLSGRSSPKIEKRRSAEIPEPRTRHSRTTRTQCEPLPGPTRALCHGAAIRQPGVPGILPAVPEPISRCPTAAGGTTGGSAALVQQRPVRRSAPLTGPPKRQRRQAAPH